MREIRRSSSDPEGRAGRGPSRVCRSWLDNGSGMVTDQCLLPNRRVPLDLVDQEPAGGEGLIPVRGVDPDQDADLPNGDSPHPMAYLHTMEGPGASRRFDEAADDGLGHGFVGLVLQRVDREAVLLASDDAQELDRGPILQIEGFLG